MQKVITLGGVLQKAIPWIGIAVISYFGYLSIAALAGKTTVANFLFKLFGSIGVNAGVAYIFGGGGIVYGLLERRTRQKTVERLQSRVQELEKKRDPGRTSSKLTTRGETNPKDKD